ncbi:hypothetical protein H4R19_003950 [Coemansia spiralis]|nr:hypothetical protein H4R19_003950 [Coemansia spiralis]
MVSVWAEVLGELRVLVYEWRFRRSQWSASAQNMELHHSYADKTAGSSRLSYQQTLRAEAAAQALLDDTGRLGAAVRGIGELRARTERMDRGTELDTHHRVAGLTGDYAARAVDQCWAAVADDYRQLARLAQGVLSRGTPLGAVAAAAPPPPILDSDFEDRLLLVMRAEQVHASRLEEKRLGLAA